MSDSTEAQRYVWEGSIPLQIHLHESEITTLPSPPPALILGPRIGYLPLLAPLIKPYFSSTLPPGVDTVWFEYKGLPLKWYIPTGVLFDLLSLEPERPWNLTVHFRGYPLELLSPCEGEESVKWSFINSLKEAAYIINGNCKNVMNMSQPDQLELWRSFINVNMDGNLRIASKLKLTTTGEEHWTKATSSSTQARQSNTETDNSGQSQTGRVPVRLYVRNVDEDIDDLDASPVDSWDRISYMNRPVEIHKEGEDPIKKLYLGVDEHADGFLSKVFTLHDAIKSLLPEFFEDEPSVDEAMSKVQLEDMMENPETRCSNPDSDNAGTMVEEAKEKSEKPDLDSCCPPRESAIKLVRIQGITPKLEIPFTWVVKSLMNPEHFLHICVFVGVKQDQGMIR